MKNSVTPCHYVSYISERYYLESEVTRPVSVNQPFPFFIYLFVLFILNLYLRSVTSCCSVIQSLAEPPIKLNPPDLIGTTPSNVHILLDLLGRCVSVSVTVPGFYPSSNRNSLTSCRPSRPHLPPSLLSRFTLTSTFVPGLLLSGTYCTILIQ